MGPARYFQAPVTTLRAASKIERQLVHNPANPWLAWVSVPILTILVLVLTVGWLNNWGFDRIGYAHIQRDWFLALNSLLSAWPPQLWSNLTELGAAEILILVLAPMVVRYPRAWAAMLGAVPVAALLSIATKYFAAVPRPAAILDHQQFIVIGETLSKHSFPSGHSITVFAAAIAILASLTFRPRSWPQRLFLLAVLGVAATVSLSRVAIGAHWPLDLAAGAAAGWIAGLSGAWLARRYPGWWSWCQDSRGCRVLGALLLSASLLLMYIAQSTPYAAVTLWLAVSCGIATSLYLLAGKAGATNILPR